MDTIATLIDRLSDQKRIVVRQPHNLSWGNKDYCE